MVISLEGLPGAGKTTATALVARRLHADALRETTGDHPFLQQVYEDDGRDDLTVELSFLLVHANPFRRLDRAKLTICDFSPAKDLLFAEEMLSAEDLKLFRGVYTHVYAAHPLPDVGVYLQASPELCLQRVRDRMRTDPSRAFEAGMTLDRLQRMQERYELGVDRLAQSMLVVGIEAELGPEDVADSIAAALRAQALRQAS
jgi:deoxyadenosine/deoxycytidine kinase